MYLLPAEEKKIELIRRDQFLKLFFGLGIIFPILSSIVYMSNCSSPTHLLAILPDTWLFWRKLPFIFLGTIFIAWIIGTGFSSVIFFTVNILVAASSIIIFYKQTR